MKLTAEQIGNLTNLLDTMFTEESVSLAFSAKFGVDTLEELWILRNSLYDHADDELGDEGDEVKPYRMNDNGYSHYDPDFLEGDDE
jgi:hypothetical protein